MLRALLPTREIPLPPDLAVFLRTLQRSRGLQTVLWATSS